MQDLLCHLYLLNLLTLNYLEEDDSLIQGVLYKIRGVDTDFQPWISQ